MGDEDDGAAVVGQAAQKLDEIRRGLRVEIARGLVAQEQRGVVGERAGDGDALLLAPGKLRRTVPAAGQQADPVEQALRALRPVARGQPREDEGQFDVPLGGGAGEELERLEDESDRGPPELRQVVVGQFVEPPAAGDDPSGRGAIQSAEESSAQGIRAAWIGLAGMGATAVLQIFIVAISGSIALLADTLHNVGHAATTIPLIVAFRIGQRTASKRYSYGYRRAEDLVGLFISLIIALSAALIIWESVDALLNPRELTNLWWVFAAGLVGAGGNELVAVYRIRAGRRIGLSRSGLA